MPARTSSSFWSRPLLLRARGLHHTRFILFFLISQLRALAAICHASVFAKVMFVIAAMEFTARTCVARVELPCPAAGKSTRIKISKLQSFFFGKAWNQNFENFGKTDFLAEDFLYKYASINLSRIQSYWRKRRKWLLSGSYKLSTKVSRKNWLLVFRSLRVHNSSFERSQHFKNHK